MIEKVPPHSIRELVETVGDARQAALLMGVDPSTLRRALSDGETTRKQEAKADQALDKFIADQNALAAAAAAPAQLLVAVPPGKLEAFQKVAGAMGLEVVAL